MTFRFSNSFALILWILINLVIYHTSGAEGDIENSNSHDNMEENNVAQATSAPTISPTARSFDDDFYLIDEDDGYTAEMQMRKIYFSSLTDVILCLLCTFFWILWLVGTIFPTKIKHLYKTEGIVVRGYVVESYVTHHHSMDHMPGIPESDSEELDGVFDSQEEHMNLPTYTAVVSYVVPGCIALAYKGNSPRKSDRTNEHYVLHGNDRVGTGGLEGLSQRVSLGRVSSRLLAQPLNKSSSQEATMTPAKSSKLTVDPNIFHESHLSVESPVTDSFDSNKAIQNDFKRTNVENSLLDNCNTFDSGDDHWKGNDQGYYKYNRHDKTDYENLAADGDIFEDDPETIGNLFYQFGIFTPKKIIRDTRPVRVKKRFETNELLEPGMTNVEIIVLPGNPGSGILKSDFEQNEENVDSKEQENDTFTGNPFFTAMIGVVLVAVSVVGAVHGALNLPYRTRVYGWTFVIVSLTMMWPLAMLLYKTVNRIRMYMMNKIISFEPCMDKANLHSLSTNRRLSAENDFVVLLDSGDHGHGFRRGVFTFEEASAISSIGDF